MARDLASSAMDADDTFGYGTEMDVAGAALPRRKAWDRLSWSDDVLLLRGCHNQKGADLLAVGECTWVGMPALTDFVAPSCDVFNVEVGGC